MKTTLMTAALIAAATAAVAETPAGVHDWSGPWAGLSLSRPTGQSTIFSANTFDSFVDDGWGGNAAAASVGFNWQTGTFVSGVQFSYSPSTLDADNPNIFGGVPVLVLHTKVSDLSSLRLRAGKAMGQNLIFATFGLTSGQAITHSTITYGSDRKTGITVGFGVERAVADKFSVGFEYLHTDLGNLDLPLCVPQCHTEIEFGQLTVGAKYHF